jgi:predicted DNA-binding protein with PD1-like motif
VKEGTISKVIVERFQTGDDILERLNALVLGNNVLAGSFTAIGAVERAVVGSFIGEGQYAGVELQGPLEILSCIGNVSVKDGSPFVHAHVTLADTKGRAYGGHMMPGCIVGATFEISLLEYVDVELARKFDSQTKLYLLDTGVALSDKKCSDEVERSQDGSDSTHGIAPG